MQFTPNAGDNSLECGDLSPLWSLGGLTPKEFRSLGRTVVATGRDRTKRLQVTALHKLTRSVAPPADQPAWPAMLE